MKLFRYKAKKKREKRVSGKVFLGLILYYIIK